MNGLTPIPFRKGRESAPRLSEPYVPGRQHPRFWTEAEDEVLRARFPEGGVVACMPHLPEHHRSAGKIYQRARKLGLKSTRHAGEHRRTYVLTDELAETIRAAWPGLKGRGAVEALAARLSLPRWWLSKAATKLGLSMPHRKEPPWTAAEDALMRRVPLHDPHRAAGIFKEHGFHRSSTAIVVRAKRLELSRRATRPTLSGTRVARILGLDNKTVTQWCVIGRLPAVRREDRRLPQQGGSSWDVTRADLRAFILDNLEVIDIRKVEKFEFVAILVGATAPMETGEP
jgi:hypothetical protein